MKFRELALFIVLFLVITASQSFAANSVVLTIEPSGEGLSHYVTDVIEDAEFPGEHAIIRHEGRVIGSGAWNEEAGTLTIRADGIDPEAFKTKGATMFFPCFVEAKSGTIYVVGPRIDENRSSEKSS